MSNQAHQPAGASGSSNDGSPGSEVDSQTNLPPLQPPRPAGAAVVPARQSSPDALEAAPSPLPSSPRAALASGLRPSAPDETSSEAELEGVNVSLEVSQEALEEELVDESTVRPPAVVTPVAGSAAAPVGRVVAKELGGVRSTADNELLDRAMQEGATIQLPSRPWVDEVPEPVTPVGSSVTPVGELSVDTRTTNLLNANTLNADTRATASFNTLGGHALESDTPAGGSVSEAVSEPVPAAEMPAAEALQGRVLANRYLVEELLVQSPAGVLCRAYHLALDRPVVVRVLPRGLACPEAQCAEVVRIATAVHTACPENVLECLDFGVLSDGWPYSVSGKLEGQALPTLLAAEGKFVLRRVLHVGQQLTKALSAAHNLGVTHGHLQSGSVQISKPGTPAEVVCLGGFGLLSARSSGGRDSLSPRRNLFGLPFYLAPEQASSRPVDVRSDIYAIGVLLYEMMTGTCPFHEGDFDDILCQHLDDPAIPPSEKLSSPGALAKALDSVILRCLHKEPDQRYQSADELAQNLKRLEAAAVRSRRRPMQEIAKPKSTIHSPMRRSDEPQVPGAKVIVGQSTAPLSRSSVPSKAPASVRSGDTVRPRKVSRFQETVRISAKDVERALARRRGGWSRVVVEAQEAWENLSTWVSNGLKSSRSADPDVLPEDTSPKSGDL